MASIEYLTKRIEGKEKEIAKLKRQIAKGLSERELVWRGIDLERAEDALAKYQNQLATEIEKANSRNIEAILTFIEEWKNKVRKYYTVQFEKYIEAREEYYREDREYCEWFNTQSWNETKEVFNAKRNEHTKLRREFSDTWQFIQQYVERNTFNTAKFEKDIEDEANRKYDNIIERTNAITGTITDATGLAVGDTGELDGIIIGERGKAKVQTIGAGGWNIQCYHFRVLVHKVNK